METLDLNDIKIAATDITASAAPTASVNIIKGLAELPGKTLLDERAMAALLKVNPRTVRRMVARFELPPPVRLAGRATWVVERVLAHIEARAEVAARRAEQEERRIAAIGFAPIPRKITENLKGNAAGGQE